MAAPFYFEERPTPDAGAIRLRQCGNTIQGNVTGPYKRRTNQQAANTYLNCDPCFQQIRMLFAVPLQSDCIVSHSRGLSSFRWRCVTVTSEFWTVGNFLRKMLTVQWEGVG